MKLAAILRTELQGLFFVFLSFTLMVILTNYFATRMVEKEISANASQVLNAAESNIRSEFREAELALLYAELTVLRGLDAGNSAEEVLAYLSGVQGLLQNNFISSLEWLSPDVFAPERWNLYAAAEAEDGVIGITPPYIHAQTGKQVISFSKTVRSGRGNDYGIVAVDADFSFMSDYVKSLSVYGNDNAYGILTDGNFVFLAHPREEFIRRPMVEVNAEYENVILELSQNPHNASVMRITRSDGISSMLVSKRMFNGWFIGIMRPITSHYQEVRSMIFILAALGIIFMLILSFIFVRLSISKVRSDEQNIEKTSFLARMSHEIRTPMNSILGVAELIKRKAVSGEIREYIEIINQSGNNLLVIINDILDFSKIESGRLEIQNRGYNIASVINDMINMMRPRIAEKSLDLLVNVDSAIPAKLFGDDMRLRQILTNLLSNAIKYTRKGFISLEIGMEKIDGNTLKLICAVKDSGIGIRAEDQERLFEEFCRIDLENNQDIEGTGLGLVITAALCRAMNGSITVSSEYGKGSVFCAVLTQEFKSEEPVAFVAEPEIKRVLFHDWRHLYVQSITSALENLKVEYTFVSGFQDFLRELQHGMYDYAFVSSKFAMDCIFIPGMRETPLQLVLMVEQGEISVYQEVATILMPIYSINIANVLNNVSWETQHSDKTQGMQFTAPDASILIVDDISTNLMVAKELMVPYEMNIQTCLSGTEALALVKTNQYDLVFMDHMMPGLDGIETTTLIRNLNSEGDYYKKLPIIALTANVIYSQREMFFASGINDFLAKPIDIQKLNEILEKWLPAEKRKPANQIQPTEEEKTAIPNIQGVDVLVGLRNCGGNMPVFLNILEDFCKDAEARLEQINDALSNDDAKLYVTMVHALKGAALSIGAMETGEKAFLLEKDGETAEILLTLADKTAELNKNVLTLISNIRGAIEWRGNRASHEIAEIPTLRLEILKTALSEMDMEAVNRLLLTFTGLNLDERTKVLIAEIEQHILMFEYDEAIAKIDKLF